MQINKLTKPKPQETPTRAHVTDVWAALVDITSQRAETLLPPVRADRNSALPRRGRNRDMSDHAKQALQSLLRGAHQGTYCCP